MKYRCGWILAMAWMVFCCAVAGQDNLNCLPIGASPLKVKLAAVEAGQLMQTGEGKTVTVTEMAQACLAADVIILGEHHDSYAVHQFQRDFIDALFKLHPRLIVGFEFFDREHDPVLEQFRSGQAGEDELIQKTGWYVRSSLNFGYTRLVTDLIQKHGIRTIGLNVPRSVVRRVSGGGWDNLKPEEKALFPTFPEPNPEHEYYVQRNFGDPAVQASQWFANFYAAQKCWDVIMAESMRLTLSKPEFKGYKGIIIAGSAHVAYGLGIPFRYRLADPAARILTMVPAALPEKQEDSGHEENPMLKMLASSLKPAAVFSRGIADFVLGLPAQDPDKYPVFGLSGKINDSQQYVVDQVTKGSLAEKAGLRAGDRLLAVDGVVISSVDVLRRVFSGKNWKDEVQLTIRRAHTIER